MLKRFFIAHKSNGFHPEVLRPWGLGLVLSLVVIFSALKQNPANHAQALDLTLQNIINGINKERSLKNLPLLNTDSRLSTAAQSKSEDMVARKYFSHTDPLS